MARKGILENRNGNTVAIAIIMLIGVIVLYFIALTTLGPALSAIVHVTEDFKEANPSDNFDNWYDIMHGHLHWISTSTFMILLALVIYVFISAIRKQWETKIYK